MLITIKLPVEYSDLVKDLVRTVIIQVTITVMYAMTSNACKPAIDTMLQLLLYAAVGVVAYHLVAKKIVSFV